MLSLMKTQFFIFKIFPCNFQYYFEVIVIMKHVNSKITFIKVKKKHRITFIQSSIFFCIVIFSGDIKAFSPEHKQFKTNR